MQKSQIEDQIRDLQTQLRVIRNDERLERQAARDKVVAKISDYDKARLARKLDICFDYYVFKHKPGDIAKKYSISVGRVRQITYHQQTIARRWLKGNPICAKKLILLEAISQKLGWEDALANPHAIS